MNGGDRDRCFEALNLLLFSAPQHAASPSQNSSAGSALAPWQAALALSACQGPGLLNDQRLHSPDAALAERPQLPSWRLAQRCVVVCIHAWKMYVGACFSSFSVSLKWPQYIAIIQEMKWCKAPSAMPTHPEWVLEAFQAGVAVWSCLHDGRLRRGKKKSLSLRSSKKSVSFNTAHFYQPVNCFPSTTVEVSLYFCRVNIKTNNQPLLLLANNRKQQIATPIANVSVSFLQSALWFWTSK